MDDILSTPCLSQDVSDDFDAPSRRNQIYVDEGCGVIVRLNKDYAVLWSKMHGLVYIKEPNCFNRPLSTWVNYKCCNNSTLHVEDGYLTKSAYDLKDIKPLRVSYKFNNTVKCQAIVRLLSPSGDKFFLTEDEVFGVVLCSRDPYLWNQFKNNTDVEVFAIFIENFYGSYNWFAIAANHDRDGWQKLKNLPERLDEMANFAFSTMEKDPMNVQNEMCRIAQDDFGECRYGPPADWISPRHINDETIEDVLGIVICHEKRESISVAYTIFGLARLRTFVDLGTWLRITMEDDIYHSYFSNSNALISKHYRVLQSEKIMPVMSTRVISPKGDEKILLCGKVNGTSCIENAYLGRIIDKKGTEMHPTGLLVEFSAFNRENGWCWELLRSHGSAIENVDHVSLKMSIFCKYMGRTCDNAHTLLVNPKYTDSRFKKTHAPLNNSLEKELLFSVFEPTSSKPVEIRTEMDDLQEFMPVQYLLDENVTVNVDEELRKYKPEIMGLKTRGMCLITKKHDVFALAYSKRFGIVLFKPDIFESVNKFHEHCCPGRWIKAYFSKVQTDGSGHKNFLKFDYIAVGTAKLTEELPRTRLTNGFLQVYISCVFNNKTVSRVDDDPSQRIVDTALGSVLFSEALYKNEFHNNEKSIWVTHISKKYGCHWKFVPNEIFSIDLLLPDSINEHPIKSDVSLFSSSLKPHELLAGFGFKSELAVEELQTSGKYMILPYNSKSTENSANERAYSAKKTDVTGTYHFHDVGEVARTNNDCVITSQELTNGKLDSSSLELPNIKSSIFTYQTHSCNIQASYSAMQHDKKEQIWSQSDKLETIKLREASPRIKKSLSSRTAARKPNKKNESFEEF